MNQQANQLSSRWNRSNLFQVATIAKNTISLQELSRDLSTNPRSKIRMGAWGKRAEGRKLVSVLFLSLGRHAIKWTRLSIVYFICGGGGVCRCLRGMLWIERKTGVQNDSKPFLKSKKCLEASSNSEIHWRAWLENVSSGSKPFDSVHIPDSYCILETPRCRNNYVINGQKRPKLDYCSPDRWPDKCMIESPYVPTPTIPKLRENSSHVEQKSIWETNSFWETK